MVEQTSREYGWPESTRAQPRLLPAADIFETDDRLVLILDMPGVAPEGVDIKLDKHVLTIYGAQGEVAPEGYSLVFVDSRSGSYERAFTLSEDIDADGIEASMRNGQLKVTLPKAGPAPARSIQVKTE